MTLTYLYLTLPNYGHLPMSNDNDEYIMPNEAFEPIRQHVDIQVGAVVACGDQV